jgi:hypothetical protein
LYLFLILGTPGIFYSRKSGKYNQGWIIEVCQLPEAFHPKENGIKNKRIVKQLTSKYSMTLLDR